MERHQHKIRVGEITPALLSQHDILFIDNEKNAWQLLLFMGLDARWRLVGQVMHKWLIFHPNGGYEIRIISPTVQVFLDSLTKE